MDRACNNGAKMTLIIAQPLTAFNNQQAKTTPAAAVGGIKAPTRIEAYQIEACGVSS